MGRSKSSGSSNCNAAPVQRDIARDLHVKNIKTVIHAASLNKIESDKYPAKSRLVNYDFLKKFVDVCKNYKVKRFIKIST